MNIRRVLERTVTELDARIEEFSKDAQGSMILPSYRRRSELIAEILREVSTAISKALFFESEDYEDR